MLSANESYQALLEPEGVCQVLPLLIAHNEAQPVKERDGDGGIVQLEELGAHCRIRRTQAQQEHALHLVKYLST